jgi:hypothetical protein
MVLALLVVAALGATVVGSLHLAIRLLRWTRRNRDQAVGLVGTWTFSDWLGDFIDALNDPRGELGATHANLGDDPPSDHGHHSAASTPEGGGMDAG